MIGSMGCNEKSYQVFFSKSRRLLIRIDSVDAIRVVTWSEKYSFETLKNNLVTSSTIYLNTRARIWPEMQESRAAHSYQQIIYMFTVWSIHQLLSLIVWTSIPRLVGLRFVNSSNWFLFTLLDSFLNRQSLNYKFYALKESPKKFKYLNII